MNITGSKRGWFVMELCWVPMALCTLGFVFKAVALLKRGTA